MPSHTLNLPERIPVPDGFTLPETHRFPASLFDGRPALPAGAAAYYAANPSWALPEYRCISSTNYAPTFEVKFTIAPDFTRQSYWKKDRVFEGYLVNLGVRLVTAPKGWLPGRIRRGVNFNPPTATGWSPECRVSRFYRSGAQSSVFLSSGVSSLSLSHSTGYYRLYREGPDHHNDLGPVATYPRELAAQAIDAVAIALRKFAILRDACGNRMDTMPGIGEENAFSPEALGKHAGRDILRKAVLASPVADALVIPGWPAPPASFPPVDAALAAAPQFSTTAAAFRGRPSRSEVDSLASLPLLPVEEDGSPLNKRRLAASKGKSIVYPADRPPVGTLEMEETVMSNPTQWDASYPAMARALSHGDGLTFGALTGRTIRLRVF